MAVLLLASTISMSDHASAQTQTSYLTYENTQYGFSIKYPSNWTKTEILQKDSTYPNMVKIVGFQNPAQDTSFLLTLVQNDKGTSQKILDEMKNKVQGEFKPSFCAQAPSGVSCSVEPFENDFTTNNGYSGHGLGFVAQMVSTAQTAQIVPFGVGIIPDGSNSWVMVFSNLALDENALNTGIFSDMSDSFSIYNYGGGPQAKQSTLVRSSAGELQLNSDRFFVTKYSPAEAVVSGKVTNPIQGVMLELMISKPGGKTEQQTIIVTKDGNFKFPLKLGGDWQSGTYIISAKYGGADIGSVSFQINPTDKPAAAKATQTMQKQKQFQLNAKADQKEDIVYVIIKNSKGSSNVYGIKITTSSNLLNYAKVKDWDTKRAGNDSVIYQTASSPLKSSDTIKIKLKVDGKNTDVRWEAFSKDQKSLGTGTIKS